MVGNANVIEDAMKLGDNIVDLGGQEACVDRHWLDKHDTKTRYFSLSIQDSAVELAMRAGSQHCETRGGVGKTETKRGINVQDEECESIEERGENLQLLREKSATPHKQGGAESGLGSGSEQRVKLKCDACCDIPVGTATADSAAIHRPNLPAESDRPLRRRRASTSPTAWHLPLHSHFQHYCPGHLSPGHNADCTPIMG